MVRQLVVRKPQNCFRRSLIPVPHTFYERELGKLGRVRRGWCLCLCPFHPDHRPSLSVNLDSGGFRCFACGAKGGDIVDFLQQRDGLSFKEAAIALGAWRNMPLNAGQLRSLEEKRRRHDRLRSATLRLAAAERALRLAFRSEVHVLARLQRGLRQRLSALLQGAQENASGETESCWCALQLIADEIREATAGYYLLAFAAAEASCTFVLNPQLRAVAIAGVLERGYVAGDGEFVMEVSLD